MQNACLSGEVTIAPRMATAKLWSVLRQRRKDGPVYPIRINWSVPQTETQVRSYVEAGTHVKGSSFYGFKYFDFIPRE